MASHNMVIQVIHPMMGKMYMVMGIITNRSDIGDGSTYDAYTHNYWGTNIQFRTILTLG